MRQQGIEEEAGKLTVVGRFGDTKPILRTGSNNELVYQWVAFAVYLLPQAFAIHCSISTADCEPLAIGFAVSANHRLLLAGGMDSSIYSKHGDRNFQHDRVDVETSNRVGSKVVPVVCIFSSPENSARIHAKVEGIKSCAKIDVEGIVDRSRKYANIVAQIIDTLLKQLLVLGHRAWSDIGRDGKQRVSGGKVRCHAVLDHGDAVGLAQAQTCGA